MRHHAVEETFVMPVSFEKFCGYVNNVNNVRIDPNTIADEWLNLPEDPERPGIRNLIVVRRV